MMDLFCILILFNFIIIYVYIRRSMNASEECFLNIENCKKINDLFNINYDININININNEINKKTFVYTLRSDGNRSFCIQYKWLEHKEVFLTVIIEITQRMLILRKINHDLKNLSNTLGAIIFLHSGSKKMKQIIDSIKLINNGIKNIYTIMDLQIIAK